MADTIPQHLRRVRALAVAQVAAARDDAASTLEAWSVDRVRCPTAPELAVMGGEADPWRALTTPERRAIAERVHSERADGLEVLADDDGPGWDRWHALVSVLIAADRVTTAAGRPGSVDLAQCPALGGASVDDHLSCDVTGDGVTVPLAALFGRTDDALEALADVDAVTAERAYEDWARTILDAVDDDDVAPDDPIARAITTAPPVMGLAEVAAAAGVALTTASSWYRRGHLPPTLVVLKATPVWDGPTMAAWIARRERDAQHRAIPSAAASSRAGRAPRVAASA